MDIAQASAAAGIEETVAPIQEDGSLAIGKILELWRYPVKSMLGERVQRAAVTARGVVGDRLWALRDLETDQIASAKKYPRLLEFRARYDAEPTAEIPGRVRITTPDGREFFADDGDASEIVSDLLARPLRLECRAGAQEKTAIDPDSVFGDVPVEELKPDWRRETMPDYFELMPGSFMEIGPLFLVTSGSIEYLRALQGGTALIDRRRFRPNIYIEAGAGGNAFVEDSWLGRSLELGDEVRLDEFQPTLWCVTSTLAQEELPRDLSILRTTAQAHRGCLGVYGSVAAGGSVRVGDNVTLCFEAASRLAPRYGYSAA
jgi:uncharacterized protein YcbX